MIVYMPKIVSMVDFEGREPKRIKNILIVQRNSDNKNVWIPSSMTHYLYNYHANDSNNTRIKSARAICGFLNYLNNQVELGEDECFNNLKQEGLFGLGHIHLARYINYISNKAEIKNNFTTVKEKEAILLNFYNFLFEKKIIGKNGEIQKKLAYVNSKHKLGRKSKKRGRMVMISPLDDKTRFRIKYPYKNNEPSTLLKDMEQDVWESFIEFAEEHYPNIALGVAFQCMGGIRLGEVVNLLIDSVEVYRKKKHMLLHIKDRQSELFIARGVNTLKSEVKVPRTDQPVFDFNAELFNLWDRHLNMLAKNPKIKYRSALFVNSYGEPMTGEVYEKEFYSLKEKFLQYIGQTKPTLEMHLRNHRWGTHIGRHIFTNHLIKRGYISNDEGKVNSKLLMVLRGDGSEQSANEYLDTKAVVETVIQHLNVISEVAMSIK
ncbi:site-specific integrase [Clostridium sp. CS001]|uniref:site-specific integrase n=1 Tax=Clostridium sp. CS001 TaxID=2880648 RepID=UPI001CF2A93C|nr:site-specific integrase [Clostridium sp. CS001]MCB2290180.1 site-specific integrase [Clostridium sp. CS001]